MKQKTTNQNNKMEKESKRNEDSVSSIWDFKHSNIHIIEIPEGEEKEQEIVNLFEKMIRERKFPQFDEGNRHAISGSTESPKQDGCKEAHSKTQLLKCQRLKIKRES